MISGKPKRAPSIAMRIWQASATSRPPPRQKPWITATVGMRNASKPVDHRMRPADLGLDRLGIAGAAEFVDVGTGNETGCFCGANDQARRPLFFQLRQASVSSSPMTSADSVLALAPFAIEQQPGDAVGIAVQPEMAIAARGIAAGAEFEHAIAENVHDFRRP